MLIAGFALVILLLATAALIGARNIQSIKDNSAQLVRDQVVANRLLDEVQQQQASLGEIFSALARDPESIVPERILSQLNRLDASVAEIAQAGMRTPQRELWMEMLDASRKFSQEVRRLVTAEEPESFMSRDLFRRHEQMISVTARLIEDSYRRALSAEALIDERSQRGVKETTILLGACLALALLFTALTVRMTSSLFRQMEWQTGELSRVSWHMLEDQETAARRFSHELHDELGQSLTAVKANLAALGHAGVTDQSRLDDCQKLVDEAISNVRQLSQLLRPTILDDFGLAAGLRWLCEGFTHRTGIEVEFQSTLDSRLPDETETHLFRIAQEALTNVARHSGAHKVTMQVGTRGGQVELCIQDDGQGLPAERGEHPEGMGMIGMRARARSAGGDLKVSSRPGHGVLLETRVPIQGATHERKDPYLVG